MDKKMSNKKLKTNFQSKSELKYSKLSFDRFGDDLCELLLSYLTINQKIRFECISKQWQRLVFNKQKSLRISNIKSDSTIDSLVEKTVSRYNSINIKALEIVLKKFKYINDIRIDGRTKFDEKILDIIANNCLYLQNISITARYIEDMPKKSLLNFGSKCGQRLKSIKFDGIYDQKMKALIKMTPNLQTITVDNISSIIEEKNDLSPVVLPKLESIHFSRCNGKQLKLLSQNFSLNIKRLRTHLLTLDLRAKEMNNALIEFSKFEKLESLDIFIDVCDEEEDILAIDEGLKRLASKCRQLRRLTFTMDGNLIKSKLFEIFSKFNSLNYLEINIISDSDFGDLTHNYGTVECLKSMKNLRQLSLHLEQLSDEHLTDINHHLPQLTAIRVYSSKTISDKILHLLAKIKTLTKIDITSYTTDCDLNITDSGVTDIILNCLNIKSISFDQKNPNFDFNITRNSVQTLIDRALSKPKIKYNFSFAVNKNEENNSKDSIENKLTTNLPSNLSIEIL